MEVLELGRLASEGRVGSKNMNNNPNLDVSHILVSSNGEYPKLNSR